MEKIEIITIAGARPQFVKIAALNRIFKTDPSIRERILHTGQHYDHSMSGTFFSELQIDDPSWNLGVGSGPHGAQTARMLTGIEEILIQEKPNVVLIYGDTNSTLAGALAASKLHVPVVHIEAGLRSFNPKMPEELNRKIADAICDLLLVPTETAANNLKNESVPSEKIKLVGDVMYDVALLLEPAAENRDILERLGLEKRKYVLATIHRAENTNPASMNNILKLLEKISNDFVVVFPVHPRTQIFVQNYFNGKSLHNRVRLLDPVSPLDMIALEKSAKAIVTDSGGVQKEAYFHRVPCVTTRDETEWTELINSGWNVLASPQDPESMYHKFLQATKESEREYKYFYGKGDAARKCVDAIKQFVCGGTISTS